MATKKLSKISAAEKNAEEVWTKESFEEYVQYVVSNYDSGDQIYKDFQWREINNMIDDVLSGKIFVNNA